MTFFDPKIYCKQNLKEKDLNEMEHWKDECEIALDMAYDKYQEEHCSGDSMMLDEIKTQIVTEFVEIAKKCLGELLQENLIECIENYEEELSPVEDPETFDCYCEEDEVEEIPFGNKDNKMTDCTKKNCPFIDPSKCDMRKGKCPYYTKPTN